MSSKTILNLNDYPDIKLRDLAVWFEKKYFKPVEEISNFPLFMGKYDVEIWFHQDMDNNQYSIELKLTDYSKIPDDPALLEALEDIRKKSLINNHSVCEYYVPVNDDEFNITGFKCSKTDKLFDEETAQTDVCQFFKNMYQDEEVK